MLNLSVTTNDPAVEAVLRVFEPLGITERAIQKNVLEIALKYVTASLDSWRSWASRDDMNRPSAELEIRDTLRPPLVSGQNKGQQS